MIRYEFAEKVQTSQKRLDQGEEVISRWSLVDLSDIEEITIRRRYRKFFNSLKKDPSENKRDLEIHIEFFKK